MPTANRSPHARPTCDDCTSEATHYEKDSSPMRRYCGKHAAKWARSGIEIRESLRGSLVRTAAASELPL